MTKAKRICTLLLRLLALAATIIAIIIMVTSRDSAKILNMKFNAKYSNTPAFKYFVIANAVVSIYSLMVLFLPSKNSLWHLVLVLDVVITMLLTSAISAALAIAYVGKKGNSHAGWLPICGQFPKFCNHVGGALIAGFVAALAYMVLLLYSLHTVVGPFFTVKA
ncbi:hypothetical protein L1049_009739 [Liquidambar formosana]|uniref:CASP-like protein n=1 Tax=Liquidambar formosana TaxID=63359 RepID=A0AAP0R6E3_LIQFO